MIGASDKARAAILARIRSRQGRGASSRPSQAELEAVETYVARHPLGPLPPVEDDVVTRFRRRAEAMQSTTEAVDGMPDVPGAVARYLQAHGLALTGCVWPRLARLIVTGKSPNGSPARGGFGFGACGRSPLRQGQRMPPLPRILGWRS